MKAVIQALEHPGLIQAVEHPGLSPHIGDNVGSPALEGVPNNPKLPHPSTIARERLRMGEEVGLPGVCGGLYSRGGSRKNPPAQGSRKGETACLSRSSLRDRPRTKALSSGKERDHPGACCSRCSLQAGSSLLSPRLPAWLPSWACGLSSLQ